MLSAPRRLTRDYSGRPYAIAMPSSSYGKYRRAKTALENAERVLKTDIIHLPVYISCLVKSLLGSFSVSLDVQAVHELPDFSIRCSGLASRSGSDTSLGTENSAFLPEIASSAKSASLALNRWVRKTTALLIYAVLLRRLPGLKKISV